MRLLRKVGLLAVGVIAGFAGAAALMRRVLHSRGGDESDELALVAIFDGIELKSRAAAFRGGSMLAWLGGIAVDLRAATLAPEAHLSVTALLGGIAIRVPPEWRIESEVLALGGRISVDVPESSEDQAPLLVVHCFTLFGGIDVRAGVPLPGEE